jgi:transmembrane sensor
MEPPASIKSLLEKYLNNRMTAEERLQFKQLLNDDAFREEWQREIEQVLAQDRFQDTDNGAQYKDAAFKNIVNVHPYKLRRQTWWAAAAIGLLLISGAGMLLSRRHINKPVAMQQVTAGVNKAILTLSDGSTVALDSAGHMQLQQGNTIVQQQGGSIHYEVKGSNTAISYNTLSTPRGGQYHLTLPDGTEVWLNAASSIKYPTAFTGSERKVEVTGEAYFDVAKNEHQPFSVQLNATTGIEVLGTQFNVHAYKEEDNIKTTLITGAVNVVSGTNKLKLQPGQQAQTMANGQQFLNTNANTDQVMAWKNGLFDFRQTSLQEVMLQLSRWYDIDVVYEGNIPPLTFDGKMDRHLSLDQIIKILTYMHLNFRMEAERKLVVMP